MTTRGRHGARARAPRVAAALVASFALLGLPTACGGYGSAERQGPADVSTISRPDLERMLADAVGKVGDPPGVIALALTRAGTWRGAAGRADLQSGRAIRVSDRFRVGSVTKTFTATVLLQLVAERKLALDDTLAERYPGVFPYGGRITLRQLLNHTSGIRRNNLDEFPPLANVIPLIRDPAARAQAAELARRWSRGESVIVPSHVYIAAAATQPLLFPPGSQFRYSNINYDLLGEIIERQTGHTLAQEMDQRIFRPLRLTNTELATTPTIRGPHAHGYMIETTAAPVDVTTTADDMRGLLGAGSGAIVSTIDALARFYIALLGGRLLPAELLEQMLTPVRTPPDWTDIPSTGYGFGQIRVQLPCGRAWGHGGGMDGYLTQVITHRSGNRIVVVAANSTGANSGNAKTQLATALYCRALDSDRSDGVHDAG